MAIQGGGAVRSLAILFAKEHSSSISLSCAVVEGIEYAGCSQY